MKLLVITQKMDRSDTVLGFFHEWVRALAGRFEKVTCLALYKGEVDLPPSIAVYSLGKEKSRCKLKYIANFFRYIWKERREYDAVFVHMNQEYVLLAGWLWLLMGKKVYLWRNHYAGNLLTDISAFFCHKIFCTSKYSYTAKFKKNEIMPVGVDSTKFNFTEENSLVNEKRMKNSILFVGRISPSKNIDQILRALSLLYSGGIEFQASFYGDYIPNDSAYYDELNEFVTKNKMADFVRFHKGIPNVLTPEVYRSHEVCVNASRSGMLDKTILESMLCGALPLVSNLDLKDKIDNVFIFNQNDVDDMAGKLKFILSLSDERKSHYREIIREFALNHDQERLMSKLSLIIANNE